MGTFSVSGLSSGIDTASLITQLMTVAAQPQTQLKSALSATQLRATAYDKINDSLSAAATALMALGATTRSSSAIGSTPVWSATTVASSSSVVAASSGAGASPGASVTFDVVSLARAQVSTAASTNGVAVSDTSNGLDITMADGTTTHVELVDGSASAVAQAVNAAGAGVRAQVVDTDGGQVLRFTGAKTGAAAAFAVSGLDTALQTVTAAADARVQVGTTGAGGYTVSSATNTFTGVESGVTFTVSALASGVTLSVASDDDRVTAGVKAAVDAVNTALATLAGTTAKGAVLNGDATVRPIAQALLGAVTDGSAGASFATYGISLTSDGRLSFDESAFRKGYAADPTATADQLGTVLAQRLSDVADRYASPTDGQLRSVTDGAARRETALQAEIDDWDTRLADQKTRLQSKFAAMESAVQRLQSQGTYLTSVFTSLTNAQSSSSS